MLSGPSRISVSGAVVSGGSSTDHVCTAGVSSTRPAGLLARTRKTWSPTPTPMSSSGDSQVSNAPASSAHSKVAPAVGEENSSVAVVSVVGVSGPSSMFVSGGVPSRISQL